MRVVLSPHNVASFPEGGGHFWVYQQYVQGLRRAGAEVWWMERFDGDRARIGGALERLARFGLRDHVLLYTGDAAAPRWLTTDGDVAADTLAQTDLLLNFHYRLEPAMLARFRRTALVDIDPGLLQTWISGGQLEVAPHDVYFTTGATVGTPDAAFPDCDLPWQRIAPAVSLDDWPMTNGERPGPFTTVSSWWGDEWYSFGANVFENNKRISFLAFREVAEHTEQPLELAANTGPKDEPDMDLMRASGWRVRHALDVASDPDTYRAYVRGSRGEFSCAKPSCMYLRNGWVSDRTLCYLASGRPAVVQDTGPNPQLDGGEGLLRFTTVPEAAAALDAVAADYEHHRRAARALAEEHFDARRVCERILTLALA
jgi:hypothetical protein